MTDLTPAAAAPARAPRRRWLAGVALAAAFAVGGLTATALSAAAQDMGPMMGHGGMHGAAMMQHVGAMLDGVGASPDQKSRIETIVHSELGPMMAAHHDMGAVHAQLMAILTAPTIDRAALEQLRATELAKFDAASRSMTHALADAAEVLTPDQRAKLAEEIRAHHHDG